MGITEIIGQYDGRIGQFIMDSDAHDFAGDLIGYETEVRAMKSILGTNTLHRDKGIYFIYSFILLQTLLFHFIDCLVQ